MGCTPVRGRRRARGQEANCSSRRSLTTTRRPLSLLLTHSYAISAILEAVGAPHFRVAEGAVFPLLVRGEVVLGDVAGQGDLFTTG